MGNIVIENLEKDRKQRHFYTNIHLKEGLGVLGVGFLAR